MPYASDSSRYMPEPDYYQLALRVRGIRDKYLNLPQALVHDLNKLADDLNRLEILKDRVVRGSNVHGA